MLFEKTDREKIVKFEKLRRIFLDANQYKNLRSMQEKCPGIPWLGKLFFYSFFSIVKNLNRNLNLHRS